MEPGLQETIHPENILWKMTTPMMFWTGQMKLFFKLSSQLPSTTQRLPFVLTMLRGIRVSSVMGSVSQAGSGAEKETRQDIVKTLVSIQLIQGFAQTTLSGEILAAILLFQFQDFTKCLTMGKDVQGQTRSATGHIPLMTALQGTQN